MEIEKKKLSFLGFEWKKLILPLVLIIFCIYITHVFYSLASVSNDITCKITEAVKIADKYRKENNTILFNKTVNEFEPILEKSQIDTKNAIGSKPKYIVMSYFMIVYPFFPVTCELMNTKYCRNYYNKESYQCMLDFIENEKSLKNQISSIYSSSEMPKYKPISFFLITLHLILIFIEGYLISAIILWILRYIKRKIKPSSTQIMPTRIQPKFNYQNP